MRSQTFLRHFSATLDIYGVGYLKRTGFLFAFAASILISNARLGFAGVTFGSGTNQFEITFVAIGNRDNPADERISASPNPVGNVKYDYGLSMFEISENMIDGYNSEIGNGSPLAISHNHRGPNKPATSITWNEAARFVNWLNTSTGKHAAYKFDGNIDINQNISLWDAGDWLDFNPENPFRSKRATYVLPSTDEWYKAAYFIPSTNSYSNYTNGLNTPPDAVIEGTEANTAVYDKSVPADVTLAGGANQNGIVGLGGNVFEWEESAEDRSNNIPSENRGIRGGSWQLGVTQLLYSTRYGVTPDNLYYHNQHMLGFRVAMVTPSGGQVPEPSTMAIFGLGALGMAYRARRKSKA
jgi:hypothetical protein